MLTVTGGENRNFNIKHKIILNYVKFSPPGECECNAQWHICRREF